VFGRAEVLMPEDERFARYWEAYRWQSDHVERGRSLDEPPVEPLVAVAAKKIVYAKHWLRRTGHAPRKVWLERSGK
jgi:hypothetical protein